MTGKRMPESRHQTEDDPLGWLRTQLLEIRRELEDVKKQSGENGRSLVGLQQQYNGMEMLLAEKVKTADKLHDDQDKRIGRLEGGFIAVGLAAVTACGIMIWESAKAKVGVK